MDNKADMDNHSNQMNMTRYCFLVGFLVLVSLGCKSAVEKQLIEIARLNELQNKTLEFVEHNELQIEVQKVLLQICEKPFLDAVEAVIDKRRYNLAVSMIGRLSADKRLMDRIAKEGELNRLLRDLAETRAQIYCHDKYTKIARLEYDLKLSRAVYDSIHALHTDAVFELSKLQSNP